MPATDMKHALISEGDTVNIVETLPPGTYSDTYLAELNKLRKIGPWKVIGSEFHMVILKQHATTSFAISRDLIERDYDEAQKVRHANFDLVADAYPLIVEPAIAPSTTLGRYICIVMTMGAWNKEVPRNAETVDYRLLDGSLEDVFSALSSEFWDGIVPFDLFDLDAGRKIELNYGNPTLRLSPDQGASFDVLDTEDYDGEIDADIRRRVLELPEPTFTVGERVIYTPPKPLGGREITGEIVRLVDNGEGAEVMPDGARFITSHVHTHTDNLRKAAPTPLADSLATAKGFA